MKIRFVSPFRLVPSILIMGILIINILTLITQAQEDGRQRSQMRSGGSGMRPVGPSAPASLGPPRTLPLGTSTAMASLGRNQGPWVDGNYTGPGANEIKTQRPLNEGPWVDGSYSGPE